MKICIEDSLHLCEDCHKRWTANVETEDGDDIWFCFADEQEARAKKEELENGGEIYGAKIKPHTVILFKPKRGYKK